MKTVDAAFITCSSCFGEGFMFSSVVLFVSLSLMKMLQNSLSVVFLKFSINLQPVYQ